MLPEVIWFDLIDEARTQMQEKCLFNNQIKQRTKMTQRGKQTGRELCTLNIHTRKTTDQYKTADTRRQNWETNEGNEGDTGGATETMIS